jgi:hypothetical protein
LDTEPTSDDLDTIEEMYVGTGGDISHGNDPDGDPIRGADHGVGNLESSAEEYLGYLSETAMNVAAFCGVSEDQAMDALAHVAGEMALEGMLGDMPEVESASGEEMSEWTGKAKTSHLQARAVEYIKKAQGHSPLHQTSEDVDPF